MSSHAMFVDLKNLITKGLMILNLVFFVGVFVNNYSKILEGLKRNRYENIPPLLVK